MSNNIKSDKLLIRARRSELIDAQNVVKLVNDATKELFGPKIKEVGKIIELIEKAVLSITIENEQDDALMAMACFYDRPNVYGVAPSAWEDWLKKMYEADKNTSLNTLFLHFFAAHSKFNIASLHEVIKSAFRAVPECHYVVLCVPQDSVPDVSMGSVFVPMKKRHVDDVNLLLKHQYTVYMTSREKHIPVLHIRDANVNDNDDLVPLFNSYTDQLKATYGDYYVAEMIEAQNENNKCLTAEAEGFGMGFMAITNDVNVSFLNECFELRPFHGLCKPHPDDLLIEPPSQRPKSSKHPTPEVKHKLSDAGLMDMTDVDQILGDDDGNMSTKSSSKSRPSNAHSTLQGSVSGESRFIPTYVGTPNAFSIQLFCIEEKYESRSLDFLPRAFEKFPDKDYCIITLPPNVPEFGLIQNFVRVTPRDTNKVNQELYLFHRGGLSESFEVREATRMSDFVAVEKLVQNLKSKAAILSDLKLFMRSRKEPTGVDVQAYVAQSMGRTVGVAIIRQEEDIEYLRSRYNIDDFIHFTHHKREEHGHLNHFALMPTFSYLTKFFVKEVLRKSNKTCLYYPIYPEYAPDDIAQKYSLITAMNYMVPVRARPQIEYNHARLGINAPSEHVLRPRYDYFLPCALNHINLKLIYEPKISINMRIVVVGASDLAISFLETLVMSQHLRFNNLTLVSTCGMPGMLSPDQFREGFAAQNMNYDSADHANLSLRSWINVIMGQLTAIDRRHKQITIDNARVISYDHLILATGEQYYYIAPMQNRVENAYTKKEIKPHLNRPMFDSLPFNMFVVNNEFEAEYLLTYLTRNHLVDSDETILIYGYDINVICSIQSLIKFGIDPKRIKVFCQREAAKACIHDPHVNTKLREVLRKLEIQIFESYQMEEWNEGHWKSGDPIDSIYFKKLKNDDLKESPRSMNVKCCALLCFYKKDVDYKIFMAANSSHLVYDGRLVIDTDFHTNDSCIRAAGKMTKYKRSYYVDSWSHACFNQKEIGVDLAQKMLKLVDPTMIVNESDEDGRTDSHRLATNEPDAKVLIPLYEKPLISYAYFPGDYFYLHVTKPGLPTPYEEEKKEGTELKTETENGYFRIHLNKNKCVQTITCFSKKNFSALNFSKIYGMHEQYLNKLLLKYEQKLVPDFYKYFSENWTTAIYHDRFQELRREIRDLSLNPDNGFKSVNDLLREQVDKDLILTRDQRATASEYFGQSNTRKLVEKRVLSYLNYNYNHLPMYVKPDMV